MHARITDHCGYLCKIILHSSIVFRWCNYIEIKYVRTNHSLGDAGVVLCCFFSSVLWIDGQTFEELLICSCCFSVNFCPELSIFCNFVT